MSKYWAAKSMGMWSGADQRQHFREVASIFPCRVVRRSERPLRFRKGEARPLPKSYRHDGRPCSSAELLASTETTGLLVLREGRIDFEQYWHEVNASTHWSTWSITKSFLATLVGIAVEQGAIERIEDPVAKYVPKLAACAYGAARIKDLLQMSSGVRWDEHYGDPNSTFRRASAEFAGGGSRDDLAATMEREFEPGTYHRYNSIDTHVLGMVLRRATRCSLAEYLRDKLWQPLGMESDGFWVVDGRCLEWAEAGLSATLRDVAKLGMLYLEHGAWRGKQLVPRAWVQAATSADAPHVQPGWREASASPFGYGYQWWIPDDSGAYCAMGVYNQFVYVDPKRRVVIAKFSASRDYARTGIDSQRELEHLALFRAIAAG